jgi:hypothetical protein
MTRSHFLTVGLSFLSALAFSAGAEAKLEVHEWGTFTSLVGSDGKAQNGMVGEDETLPSFVHDFGEQPSSFFAALAPFAHGPVATPVPNDPGNDDSIQPPCHTHSKIGCGFLLGQSITQKMETPVVYFYSDRARRVSFEVGFPNGIISQSYPAASVSRPLAVPGVALRNGFAGYQVEILKERTTLPFVETANIYSHARKTKSDLIRVGNETEKFIFYRGLGSFETRLKTTSSGGAISLTNTGTSGIPKAFLVYTNSQGGSFQALTPIPSGQTIAVPARTVRGLRETTEPFDAFVAKARAGLQASLVSAGLYGDEARAMLGTWERGYFRTPGLRVLYVLSREEVEEILPATVSPGPDHFERVFVGRIEVLGDTSENALLDEILQVGEAFDVTQLGRMSTPILGRLVELASQRGRLDARASVIFATLQRRAALN